MFDHTLDPAPFVKYALISSQYLMIRATAAPMATTAIPIGPVMVANAVPTSGANCISDPKANNMGPIAAATAATTAMVFWASGDNDLNPAAISFILVTIGVM